MTAVGERTTTPAASANRGRASRRDDGPATPVIAIDRRTIDKVLVAAGVVAVLVLAIAGALLTWGNRFASDHVGNELASQEVYFPSAEALEAEGRTDLLDRAGTQVLDGNDAKAYASYIEGHLDGIADGQTYADLSGPEREAKAAVTAARDAGADEAEIAELQSEAAAITAQRDTLFKGETLRGLLLSTYAWSTVGRIAGIAASVAFAAAGIVLVLVVLGVWHQHRLAKQT